MTDKKLPKFESIDWIGKANDLSSSYNQRLKTWLTNRPECKEIDFIKAEIEHHENDLKEPFTVGATWDRYVIILKRYISDLKVRLENNVMDTTRFRINPDMFDNAIFYQLKDNIIENGFMDIIGKDGEQIRIFTPQLYYLFTKPGLELYNMDTKKEEVFDRVGYFNVFKKGFNEGVKYFNKNIYASPDVLYGVHASEYFADLHTNYYHTNFDFNFEGWVDCKRTYPFIFTSKVIEKHGFYSGIVSKVDEMKLTYPTQSEKFTSLASPATVKSKQYSMPQIALIHFYNGTIINRDNSKEIAAQYGYISKASGEGLYQDYIKYSSAANRKGVKNPNSVKQLTNKISLLKSVESLINSSAIPRLRDELKTLETLLKSIPL